MIIVPQFSSSDFPANLDPTTGGAGLQFSGQPRMTYAIQDSPEFIPPANEVSVLAMNGARTKIVLGRPFRISCRPKPNVGVTNLTTNSVIGVTQRGAQWFNFPLSDNPADSGNLPHAGISFWSEYAQTVASIANIGKVYFKITFSLRDPK